MGGLLRATFWITDWNVHAVLIPHTLFYKKNSLFNYILKQTVDGFGGTFFNDLSDKNSLSFKKQFDEISILYHWTDWKVILMENMNDWLLQE